MESRDLSGLLESVAPTPRTPLDIGQIERRAHRRRGRRRVTSTVVFVSMVGLLIGLAAHLPSSGGGNTVVAGPPSSRTIPVAFRAGTATTEISLLDGTRLRVSVPEAVGHRLAGMTFADYELHGAVYAGPAPHGWRIDVAVGSIERLVPGGEPIVVPPSSQASAATVDRPGRRLALQFGSWALVASGDSLGDADIDTLLTSVGLAETADGFVEYRGSLPLWTVDDALARLGGTQTAVSVFIGGPGCGLTTSPRRTAGGLDAYRVTPPRELPGSWTMLCDPVNQLRIDLHASRPLTDEEIDRVRIHVVSLGPTLAALQRGEHP